MKRYGLRIGDIGVEFSDRDTRQRALAAFTAGGAVKISSIGRRYTSDTGSFSVYERDDSDIQVNCAVCNEVFNIESAANRKYPIHYSWRKDNEWEEVENHICDADFAKKVKEKELADAKGVIENNKPKAIDDVPF